MRSIVLDQRAFCAIVEALNAQIEVLARDLANLDHCEETDDARSDLNNDIGYLEALTHDLAKEAEIDLKDTMAK
jgi:hypothetical protein